MDAPAVIGLGGGGGNGIDIMCCWAGGDIGGGGGTYCLEPSPPGPNRCPD